MEERVDLGAQPLRGMRLSSAAALSTCSAALPVLPAPWLTPSMLAETESVPRAASGVLRVISLVAALCSSIAEAIDAEISLTSVIVRLTLLMATTAPLVAS